jgi:nitric oxide dioxygenase
MLSSETRAIVQKTVPTLRENGEALTRHFYRRMFTYDPAVKAYFNPAHQHAGTQQKALASAILAYAENIEDPSALAQAIDLIAHKHASLGVQPEHYPIVGKHLLGSIKELLGDAATDDIITAWGEAYNFLADVCIQREAELYGDHEREHGWTGFREFIIDRTARESDVITSLYLKPTDRKPLEPFMAGQYLTVRVALPDGGTTMRNYSLSCKSTPKHYRISVKRERAADPGVPPGYVSHQIHERMTEGDTLEVGPPCGNFVLDDAEPGRPLALVSGGVGITPLLAMMHESIERWPGREVVFIHGAVNSRMHAFRDEVRHLASSHMNLKVHFRYSEPLEDDHSERRCDSVGLLDAALLRLLLSGPEEADFYFCGPPAFMSRFDRTLDELQTPAERRRHEFFGPAQAAVPVNA